MSDREIIETTESGYQRVAAVAVRHRGPDGSFVSEDLFTELRNAEIRGEYGYGLLYGAGGYGH